MLKLAMAFVLVLVGCSVKVPSPDDGAFACNDSSDCASGYYCNDQRCQKNGPCTGASCNQGAALETILDSTPPNPSNSRDASFSFHWAGSGVGAECKLDSESSYTACSAPKQYTGLADGSHHFEVRAKDANGAVDPTPAGYDWTITTAIPDTIIDTWPASPSSPNVSFTFHATPATTTFECRLDGTAWMSCSSPKAYTALGNGGHVFEVRATSAFGADPTPASWSFTVTSVDTTPPDATVSGPAAFVASTTATFYFTCSEAGCTFTCVVDGVGPTPCGATHSVTVGGEGTHTLAVTATDANGNPDPSPANYTWVVDLTPPMVTGIDGLVFGHPTFFPYVLQLDSGSVVVSCSDVNGCTVTCSLDNPTGAGSCGSIQIMSAGDHVVYVTATDAAGNAATELLWVALSPSTWRQVSSGAMHTCAIGSGSGYAGTLWCWGWNTVNQVGSTLASASSVTLPTNVILPHRVDNGSDWQQVSAGGWFTCGLKGAAAPFTLYCWGGNESFQMGNGTTNTATTPVQVGDAGHWSSVSAGRNHVCAIDKFQHLRCWGMIDYSGASVSTYQAPTAIDDTRTFATVSSGDRFACGVDSSANLRCFGAGNLGQLGDGLFTDSSALRLASTTSTFWQAVAAGNAHACAIHQTGDVYCWGANNAGQAGATAAGTPTPLPAGTFRSIAAGAEHTCASDGAGNLKCWGSNSHGQLGLGDTANRNAPTQVATGVSVAPPPQVIGLGQNHSCMVKGDNTLWCWGSRHEGQVGSGTSGVVPVGAAVWDPLSAGNLLANTVALGGTSTCAVDTALNLRCWGDNFYGQLGIGSAEPRQRPALAAGTPGYTALTLGNLHACGIQAGGAYCWGYGNDGELGLGDTQGRNQPTRIGTLSTWTAIAAGLYRTCGIQNEAANVDKLFCWGEDADSRGLLGVGAPGTNRVAPTLVLGGYQDWVAVALGQGHLCGIHKGAAPTDNTLTCWGSNGSSQLGDGGTTDQAAPVPIGGALKGWVKISAGGFHTCAIRRNGVNRELYCWGDNGAGQLGLGDFSGRSQPTRVDADSDWLTVEAADSTTCGVRGPVAGGVGSLWCWGYNYHNIVAAGATQLYPLRQQLGTDTDWADVRVGSGHVCGVKSDKTVRCWGDNDRGELGDGVAWATTPERLP